MFLCFISCMIFREEALILSEKQIAKIANLKRQKCINTIDNLALMVIFFWLLSRAKLVSSHRWPRLQNQQGSTSIRPNDLARPRCQKAHHRSRKRFIRLTGVRWHMELSQQSGNCRFCQWQAEKECQTWHKLLDQHHQGGKPWKLWIIGLQKLLKIGFFHIINMSQDTSVYLSV